MWIFVTFNKIDYIFYSQVRNLSLSGVQFKTKRRNKTSGSFVKSEKLDVKELEFILLVL